MRSGVLLAIAFLATACSFHAQMKKDLLRMEESFQEHAGFVLYDPASRKTIFSHNGNRYFTPASNTKIFTFYGSLRVLKDSVQAFRYEIANDTMKVEGVGDPSFLYKYVHQSGRAYNFLQSSRYPVVVSPGRFNTEHFGPGWAWDDYPYYYSAERSFFPIYGNIISMDQDSIGTIRVSPSIFKDSLNILANVQSPTRKLHSNRIDYRTATRKKNQWDVPMRYSHGLLAKLLSDTLHRLVEVKTIVLSNRAKVLKSTPLDSLLRVLMQESDNFIAEQLLLQCAVILSDTLKPEIAIREIKKNYLSDLPDDPQWVDGSGLSRYNLFTPRSIVVLWDKIAKEVPRERLFPLLATGGAKGTIRNYFKGPVPYIYGKTGSLSNNHCLSGYLITRSGRLLIFSFMHNNFVQPTRKVRTEMEKFLNRIHEKY